MYKYKVDCTWQFVFFHDSGLVTSAYDVISVITVYLDNSCSHQTCTKYSDRTKNKQTNKQTNNKQQLEHDKYKMHFKWQQTTLFLDM